MHTCTTARPSVAILMCSFNGERFIAEQMDSFERQTHRNWRLFVSDDGSHDGTLPVLEGYIKRWGKERLSVIQGEQKGFVKNFLSLTCRADIDTDFFAWADQDDIWLDDKLEAALAWLETIPASTPALYCGRTRLINASGTHVGFSPRFYLPPSFTNALVQNIGGGNTMVFNQAARALIQEAGADLVIPSHDWWAYQLICGVGGVTRYDPQPHVLYRQHGSNLVGSNGGWRARFVRLRMVVKGRFHDWNTQNIDALGTMCHRLTKKNQTALGQFKAARAQCLFPRITGVLRAGLHRQTLLGTLGLIFATLIKKI